MIDALRLLPPLVADAVVANMELLRGQAVGDAAISDVALVNAAWALTAEQFGAMPAVNFKRIAVRMRLSIPSAAFCQVRG